MPVFFMVLRYLFYGVDKLLKASFARSKLLISDDSMCAAAGGCNVLLAALGIDFVYLCSRLLDSSFGYKV